MDHSPRTTAAGKKPESLPIGIVGAGPAGMTAAIVLAELGVPVEIYERNAKPTTEWRAPAIHARTLELFARYNLIDPVLAAGNSISKMTMLINGSQRTPAGFENMRSEFPMAIICAQTDTEEILRKRLAELGVQIHWCHEFVDYTHSEKGVVARFIKSVGGSGSTSAGTENGSTVSHSFAYLIGCDGGRSRMRKAIGATFVGKTLETRFAVGDVQAKADWVPNACLVLNAEGLMGIFRVRPNQYRVFFVIDESQQSLQAETFIEIVRRRTAPKEIGDPVLQSFSVFTVNERRSSQFISEDGRVFLCGDAGHAHSPAGGQGMNASIQDAENLAWKLAMVYHGQAQASVLKTYAMERMPAADAIIALSAQMLGLVLRSAKMVSIASMLMKLAEYRPISAARKAAEQLAQLAIVYTSADNPFVAPELAAWSEAAYQASSWWPFSWAAEDLCVPGARAIDGQVIERDAANRSMLRLRQWQSRYLGAHTAVVFVDCHILLSPSSAGSPVCQMDSDSVSQLAHLAEMLSACQPAIPVAVLLHSHENVATATRPADAILDAVTAQLHKRFPTMPILVDTRQEARYDQLTLSDLYACTNLHKHAVYLIRPDAYVASRAPLDAAADAFRKHIDAWLE
ncbi:FAD binding domain-containing protein [Thamnocephalis sphaerospora]|uniref:FAD binding domain-containing protein n=1 Tax=Thamnocephalis sphaerospora TaxID=78915 RepID=A0A4P9XNL7_9FUNG|nr:FAD binding domain-containing protein [Thamnocephalis sphaerospora]|eukprot:RKP07573.1 FAD binding domain-containing protein [Thamnocephalis sphaerospora]